MKTISDFLKVIREDQDIQKIIAESPELRIKYKPRKTYRRFASSSEAGIDTKHFWSSFSGVEFRMLLEHKYNICMGSMSTRGAVKDALLSHLSKTRKGDA